MKNYDGLNDSNGVHTIKVSLQDGEFKGSFTHEIGGNCKGAELLDFDIQNMDDDEIKDLKKQGCVIKRPDDDNYLFVKLTSDAGDTCDFEVDDDEFQNMIVGIEIIDFKVEGK